MVHMEHGADNVIYSIFICFIHSKSKYNYHTCRYIHFHIALTDFIAEYNKEKYMQTLILHHIYILYMYSNLEN